jgi:diguanylate cyclase (GGDEF)-like protein
MPGKKSIILVVDDRPANLKVLLSFLKVYAFSIRVAESGERALRSLEDEQPDLILLDVMMPGINGFETCKQIKANKATADIPVIFMTALDSLEDKVAGFAAGGVDYITKPFQQIEVLARIKTHLTMRQQKQALEKAQNKLLQQKQLLEKMSITDDLTGLYNRRHLNTVLKREFRYSERYTVDLSCLLLDLDHFKKVNDTYGHEFGDTVLRKFSTILSNCIRSSDYVFRFGGEVFVILLPHTDREGAKNTGEKFCNVIAGETIQDNDSDISITVTVSIGVSTMQTHQPEKPHDLINLADKALYTAKENGRNQVVVYDAL